MRCSLLFAVGWIAITPHEVISDPRHVRNITDSEVDTSDIYLLLHRRVFW